MKVFAFWALSALVSIAALSLSPDVSFAKSKSCKTLNAIDPDNDGQMTLEEAKARATIVFEKLNRDKAKDSTLDAKELRGRLSAKELKAANPDNDGTLDKAEYLAAVEARFKAANPDGDQTIECKELSSKAGKALLKLLK
jgi:Ca2+-binding EF-hand superfamily protein